MGESWSFRFEGGHPERHYRQGRVAFGDGPFTGSMERVEVRAGLNLYHIEGRSTHRCVLRPDSVTTRGTIVLGNMLAGSGRIALEGAQERHWRNERSFFALTPDMPVAYHIEPDRQWSIVGLVISPETLSDLAGDELPKLAAAIRDGRAGPVSIMRQPGRGVVRLATELADAPRAGRMAALSRQARCLAFLAGALDMLAEDDDRAEGISPRERARVREARERLVADLRQPPDLHQLAYSAGLGIRRFNECFRMLYGVTAFDYLRDARLDAARRMLEEGATPLKQIAWQVGYTHPTNLIGAYRRRFGISPGRDRRSRPRG